MNDRQTSFKELSTKAKLEHIWEYYRIPIIIGIFVVAIIGSLLKATLTHVTPVLSVLMVNTWSDQTKAEDSLTPFMEQNGYRPEEVVVDTSVNLVIDDTRYYQEQTRLFVLLASKEYDVMFADQTIYDKYAGQGCFRNLEDYLSEEELAALKDRLYYATDAKTGERYPCAIYFTEEESKWLKESYTYHYCYFSILFSDHTEKELIHQFIKYILGNPDLIKAS